MSLQRIVGFAGQEWYYAVQVELEMNEQEQAIAEQIRTETGAELFVKVQGPKELSELLRLGYSTPFIFSEQKEESVYYTLQESPDLKLFYSEVDADADQESIPSQSEHQLSKRLFSDFFFWENSFALHPKMPYYTSQTTYLFTWEEPFRSQLVPPPRQA